MADPTESFIMSTRTRRPAPSGRRTLGNDPPRKTGWQVRCSVADAVRRAVEEGAAESQNAFVERALVRELRELRRRRVYDAYAAAAADPAYRLEIEGVGEAFETTVGDGLTGSDS
jgi:hypothetical protein